MACPSTGEVVAVDKWAILRDLTMERARAMADGALRCKTSAEVRQLVREFKA